MVKYSKYHSMQLSSDQKMELAKLEQWFQEELYKLKKKELAIINKYDQKVSIVKQAKVKKMLDNY